MSGDDDRAVYAAILSVAGAILCVAGALLAVLAGLLIPWGSILLTFGVLAVIQAVLVRLGVMPMPGGSDAQRPARSRDGDRRPRR